MPDFNRLIAALSDAGTYHEVTEVRVIQTQMSVVFLAGEYVYKVKKPINLGYVDYTQLERRKYFCEHEVDLNRRLCPDTYLGVVPITASGDRYVLGGPSTPIEYAVKMRRLPDDKLLDKLLKQDEVTPAMMEQIATKLARFHQDAATGEEIAKFGSPEAITRNTEESFSQTEKYIGQTISPEQYTTISSYTRNFIRKNDQLFAKRAKDGRIRDCHGDLHAQHICFCHDLCIFDCIEFNDRFRYSDTAAEVAFLAMDLERSGRADLARSFVTTYISESGDDDLIKLLGFYKCYRAYVRGKVNSFKTNDPYVPEDNRRESLAIARGYFDLAAAYTRTKPLLITMTGFVGSGKTTMAQELAGRLGAIYLSSDITRKRLAGIPLTEHRYCEPEGGIYSAEFTRRTYDTLYREAEEALSAGYPVVLDGAFLRAQERASARHVAECAGADFFLLECQTDVETVRTRLEARLGQASTPSDGCWEVYVKQQEWREPPDKGEPGYVIINALSNSIAQTIDSILAHISATPNPSTAALGQKQVGL